MNPDINIDRENAIDLLLISIAMEELGLAHIINAEAEKIQFILGTLENSAPTAPPTLNELLEINSSVESMLKTVIKKEMLLQFKLEDVIELVTTTTTTTSTTTTTTTTTRHDE